MPTVLNVNPSITLKRKVEEPRVTDNTTPTTKRMMTRPALGLNEDKRINGDPNGTFPLVINAVMLDHRVGGCLVDEGNPVDILYQCTFERLGLRKEDLRFCYGIESIGPNKTNSRSWWYEPLRSHSW